MKLEKTIKHRYYVRFKIKHDQKLNKVFEKQRKRRFYPLH